MAEREPFDESIDHGDLHACMYAVSLRQCSDERAARSIVDETRQRVRQGRAIRPDAAHYVQITDIALASAPAATLVLAQLGQGDGIDSVGVEGAEPAGPTETPPPAAPAEPTWARLERLIQDDDPTQATVRSLEGEEPIVEVLGVPATLLVQEGDPPAHVGETLAVRLVTLNVKRRLVRVARC